MLKRSRILFTGVVLAIPSLSGLVKAQDPEDRAKQRLADTLDAHGFTGRIEATLPARLGRPIDPDLTELGRLLFFDPILALHNDNSCAGCHAPSSGLGDSGSMAIGVDSNGLVGPGRIGPRNQRRAPIVVNSAFFPKLMWNGRFFSPNGDPFDNSEGFTFPFPEGTTRFPPGDDRYPVLLTAQAHIPSTELVEMAGFTGTAGTIGPEFDQFDNGVGEKVPPPDETGTRNEPIRTAVLERLNDLEAYLDLFGGIYNEEKPLPPGGIEFHMIGQAVAEFEMSLTFADAPIDRFARGDRDALTFEQARGGLLFFGKARCSECHAVDGDSNEMFSDFTNHAIGTPQIAPVFGVGTGNVIFDGPGQDEDFGAEQISRDPADRYKFRTPPLRNLAVQPAFMHNGAFTRLEDAVQHHLHARKSARRYDPEVAGVDADLSRLGPIKPVLKQLDRLVSRRVRLTPSEFNDLLTFVRDALTDPRVLPENLCTLVPDGVPSGMPLQKFENCK